MYSREQKEIINLADNYTLLYSFLGEKLIKIFGEEGERALREGTRRFGRDRAEAQRDRHLKANIKINMKSLFTIGHDLPADPRFRRELQEINPQERVSHTIYCPMAAIWKEYGAMDIGRIYCEEFHNSCYSHYGYGYTKVNLAKTQTQAEDEYCAFNIILRPENLPDELKPVCFAEYDPTYTGPSGVVTKINEKVGFTTILIKLYYHIATAALEQIGEKGIEAIKQGLQDAAIDAAARSRSAASDQECELTPEFVFSNYPLTQDPNQEPLWYTYDQYGLKELLIENFYKRLYEELHLTV